jgi:hypothetical protein
VASKQSPLAKIAILESTTTTVTIIIIREEGHTPLASSTFPLNNFLQVSTELLQ